MPSHTPVITKDQSITLTCPIIGEAYHATNGAWREIIEKYVKPSKISSGMKLLDFCFGLGYTTLGPLSVADSLTVVALEQDCALLQSLHTLSFQPASLQPLYQSLVVPLATIQPTQKLTYTVNTSTITIIADDARFSILTLNSSYFDAIYYDPFSPAKQPELWTVELFAQAFRVLKPGGILCTYSYARVVRDGLAQVGFRVTDGPIVGRRSPCIVAYKPL
jgi:predicted methyltransferase